MELTSVTQSWRLRNIMLPGAVILLIALGWTIVLRQIEILTQTTIAAYQQTELEIVRALARNVKSYVHDQVEAHGRTDITQIEQDIFERFIAPVHLLNNGDAWIYAPDHVVFDLSSDFPEAYRGKGDTNFEKQTLDHLTR
jgi:two-component system cell cycle sensor histidine kinase/response regulator CckA